MTDTPEELPAVGHTSSERLTSPPTVRSDLPKRRSAKREAATYSHGGSQASNPSHLITSTKVDHQVLGFWCYRITDENALLPA
jgi:hypothetical protein